MKNVLTLRGGYLKDFMGYSCRDMKGNTRTLDYSSFQGPQLQSLSSPKPTLFQDPKP